MNAQKVIARAVAICGGQTALANAIGVSPAMVWQWIKGKRPIPAERCADIEKATGGHVSRSDLRPDLWEREPKREAA